MSMDTNQQVLEKLKTDLAQTGTMPLYLCFNESVRQAMESGILQDGDFLPSERQFTEALGISRITVRKALAKLEQDGHIGRSRGYGTFIKKAVDARLSYSLAGVKGFSREVMLQGRKPDTLWISRDQIPASALIASKLAITEGTPVYMLKRIHYIDTRPMSVAVSYVIMAAIGDVQDIGVSLYDYFSRNNIELGALQSRVNAAMSDAETLQSLQLTEPMPLLIIKQTLFDGQNRPIEYSESFCRSDMYEFISED